MLKSEMAERIAVALYPPHFDINSPAIQGEIVCQMKKSKPELVAVMDLVESVESVRENKKLDPNDFI